MINGSVSETGLQELAKLYFKLEILNRNWPNIKLAKTAHNENVVCKHLYIVKGKDSGFSSCCPWFNSPCFQPTE